MRCLTIGAELKRRGWKVRLMVDGLDLFLSEQTQRIGIETVPIGWPVGGAADLAAIRKQTCTVVVLDSYEFTHDFIRSVGSEGTSVVLLDDNGFTEHSDVDLVINQNIHASTDLYPRLAPDRLLLGLRFALIRDEVRAIGKQRHLRTLTDSRKVIVAVGGTDILGLAPRIAAQLIDQIKCKITVAGSKVPEGCEPTEPDIACALSRADLAIIGAGTTMWEALFLGTPVLALVVADNQSQAALRAESDDLISSVDCRSLQSVSEILEVSKEMLTQKVKMATRSMRGMSVVDGEGVGRVANAIEDVVGR